MMTWMYVLGAFVIGPVWAIVAISILRSCGKRAWWDLLGLPFALNCNGTFLPVFVGCVTGHPCP